MCRYIQLDLTYPQYSGHTFNDVLAPQLQVQELHPCLLWWKEVLNQAYEQGQCAGSVWLDVQVGRKSAESPGMAVHGQWYRRPV